jgi:hypothetical protein
MAGAQWAGALLPVAAASHPNGPFSCTAANLGAVVRIVGPDAAPRVCAAVDVPAAGSAANAVMRWMAGQVAAGGAAGGGGGGGAGDAAALAAAAAAADVARGLDTAFILFSGFLVFLMQAGFAMVRRRGWGRAAVDMSKAACAGRCAEPMTLSPPLRPPNPTGACPVRSSSAPSRHLETLPAPTRSTRAAAAPPPAVRGPHPREEHGQHPHEEPGGLRGGHAGMVPAGVSGPRAERESARFVCVCVRCVCVRAWVCVWLGVGSTGARAGAMCERQAGRG